MTFVLQRMNILAFKDAKFLKPAGVYIASLNPETYSRTFKVNYNDDQGAGTSGTELKYNKSEPEVLEFEFLFDTTGAISDSPIDVLGVEGKLKGFKKVVMGFDGDIHRPKYLILNWGTLFFKCCAESLTITYKLFNPEGLPIRATAKVSFKEFQEKEERVAKENANSPDLTHIRTVKEGDTLPLMAHDIYGDSRYYLEVARSNGLTNFRKLKAGQRIFFPPLEKSTNA